MMSRFFNNHISRYKSANEFFLIQFSVRGNNNLLHKPVLSSTPISIVTNLTDVITNVTRGQG